MGRVVRTPLKKELIIVDDGSSAKTAQILRAADSLRAPLAHQAKAAFELKTLFGYSSTARISYCRHRFAARACRGSYRAVSEIYGDPAS